MHARRGDRQTTRPGARAGTVVGAALAGVALLAGVLGACGGGTAASGSPSPVPSAGGAAITPGQVQQLVDTTCRAIAKDAPATLEAISDGAAPYKDPANPSLYAFVYTPDVTLVATPDDTTRGQNMRGKTDAAGKPFRDILVKDALASGSGWITYVYKDPGRPGLFLKATYYQAVTGSDGVRYVVCAGRYAGTVAPSPSPAG